MNTPGYGFQTPYAVADEESLLRFFITSMLSRIQTVATVTVMACTNSGALSPVGTVDVQPNINQVTGNGTAVPHGTIYKVPYFRLQGGQGNAIILDPQPGDIGMCGFCSRDISALKASQGQAQAPATFNPGSSRSFDYADALYFGGFMNGPITQYIAFSASGIIVSSPQKITLRAPVIDIEASSQVIVNAPTNTIKGGGTSIDGKLFLPHEHSGVQSGASNTGPVV